jgi:hypothetical protein
MCRVKTVLYINLSLLTTSSGATNWANVPLAALVNLTIHTLQRGSMGVAKKITTIQRIAALAITGAMRSTATDLGSSRQPSPRHALTSEHLSSSNSPTHRTA